MRLHLILALSMCATAARAGEVVRTRGLGGGRTLTIKKVTDDAGKLRLRERSLTGRGGWYLHLETKSYDANGKPTESSLSDWATNRTRHTTSQYAWGTVRETQWQIGDREFLAENTTHTDGTRTWERMTQTKNGLTRYSGKADQKGAPLRVRFASNMLIDAGIQKMIDYAGQQKQPVQMEMSRGAFVVKPGDKLGEARQRFDSLR